MSNGEKTPTKHSVDVVIPVYNEEQDLQASVTTLRRFLGEHLSNPWRITVADNGSTDDTPGVAQSLAQEYFDVKYIHLDHKGRGRALKRAWLESDAQILCYMDVDLSTNLEAFPNIVTAIENGYDIAIGTRLGHGAQVQRSPKREIISRAYMLLIKSLFFTQFTDAQCGFKAISRGTAQRLIPLIKDNAWFFDTELLILAEKRGFRTKEVPVKWVEDPDTRVKILRTARDDIKGLLRLRFGGLPKVMD